MRISLVLLLPFAVSTSLSAQILTGFTPAHSVAQQALESRLQAVPDPLDAQRHARVLAAKPHVAGTPQQLVTAQYVLSTMASWGLDTQRVVFKAYIPYPDSTIVERITPTRLRLDLREPGIPSDPSTQGTLWPAMNGTSGIGDVTAPIIYVNYGLPSDYKTLDSLHVSVTGKIVLARYGRSFRGIKAREAEAHGAVGLLLYSDPKDDGFVRGAVYPDGPWRNPQGVQRGSVYNGIGDPTTPGWPSLPNAKRIPEDSLPIAHIPVVPISYGNSESFLKEMSGAGVPESWQGGLTFPYHTGDDKVRARVAVWAERGARAYKTIINTFGILRGTEFPNEMVIVGGHRDAWGPGAADDISGVVGIMEAAKAWGTVAKAGMRPRRTLIFATWDAEEWGLVGSSEWVELMSDSLRLNAVAYINQDMSAWGRHFDASGAASVQGLLRDVTKTVKQPGGTSSVFDVWEHESVLPGSTQTVPPVGDLGGGSDFLGFYNHLGIPSIEFGFGGNGGVYHSAYDTYTFQEKFGDVGYLAHAAAARLTAVLMARLSQADIEPFDYAALGSHLRRLATQTLPDSNSAESRALIKASERLRSLGEQLNASLGNVLASGQSLDLSRVNREMRDVERRLTRPEGLVGRPFMRNLVFASDRDNGYSNIALPGIAEAIRDGDMARMHREVVDLTERIEQAGESLSVAMRTARIAVR